MQISESLTVLEMIYQKLYIGVLIILALMLFVCLIRAVKGPRVADRLMAVNMMGTIVMVMIAVLALLLKEGFLVDICLIYALVSFLAVNVLAKVYIGVYEENYRKRHKNDNGGYGKGDGGNGNS
ncbi:monovalent cation/H+ antiporter complex subunit F [Lachnospiraceae bacterium 54-11]|nr:sodium:proton antiporter [Lachnospiraceae bacterium]MCI9326965.1 sodium:proton antiporter [Lachnospiraceae bacterium]